MGILEWGLGREVEGSMLVRWVGDVISERCWGSGPGDNII